MDKEAITSFIGTIYKQAKLCDETGIGVFSENITNLDVAKAEIFDYLVKLAGIDEVYSAEDICLIQDITGVYYEEDQIMDYAVEFGVTAQGEYRLPVLLKMTVEADNCLSKVYDFGEYAASPIVCRLYYELSNLFIEGNPKTRERIQIFRDALLTEMIYYVGTYLDDKFDSSMILDLRDQMSGNKNAHRAMETPRDKQIIGYEMYKVLKQEYYIPEIYEIVSYKNLMKEILDARNMLNAIIDKQMAEYRKKQNEDGKAYIWLQNRWYDYYGEICGDPDADESGLFITQLQETIEERAIFVCPNNDDYDKFGVKTAAYKELSKLKNSLVHQAKQVYFATEQAVENGNNNAYKIAAANIKGMHYGIITNSPIDLLAYDMISYSVLKSQARKADRQYSELASKSAITAFNMQRELIESITFNQYFPVASKYIDMWTNEVTELAITIEAKEDHPVYAEIKNYSIKQSQDILEKINSHMSQEEILEKLQEAFEKCPYNENIYVKAIKYGLMDEHTLLFGLQIDLGIDLVEEIRQYCKDSHITFDILTNYVSLLATCEKKSREALLKEFLTPRTTELLERFKYYRSVIQKMKPSKRFVLEKLGYNSIETFINEDNTNLSEKLESLITSTADEEDVKILTDYGGLDLSMIALSDENKTLKEIMLEYHGRLFDVVKDYKSEMQQYYQTYCKNMEIYQIECNNYADRILQLDQTIANMGMLSILKRKKAQEELITLKTEYESFRENNAPKFNWL